VKLLSEVDWLYVCEIKDILDLPFYAISRHLKELKIGGLVSEEKEGRFVKYSLIKGSSPIENKLWELIALLEDETTQKDRERRQKRMTTRDTAECSLCENSPQDITFIKDKKRRKP
jgi:DNA-binding transcriptional ArsR family regulator